MTEPPREAASLGVVEWFRMGDHAHAEATIDSMRAANVRRLRTQFSWAEYHVDGAEAWYDWLMPRLGAAFDVMPCFHYTPPSISRTGRSSGAPKRLRDYADFIDLILTRHGAQFEAVELWNEPNNLLDWDWRADPTLELFSEMIRDAANWVRQRGFRAVMGGPNPFDPKLLEMLGERGVLELVSAAGIHGFPGTWDSEAGSWLGWADHLAEARSIVGRYNPEAEVWITEAGYSVWSHDEMEQVRRFLDAFDAGADRVYWYAWRDVPEEVAVQEGHWFDARHYHLGAVDARNRPRLLGRLLTEGGPARARRVAELAAPPARRASARPVAITGGCGFIGTNLAESFLADGDEVILLDNLSRAGVDGNLDALRQAHGAKVRMHCADIRNRRALPTALEDARAVFHLAAQTAVTTSLGDPSDDFDINARGTLNILGAVRAAEPGIPVVFASTNKVYGNLADLALDDREGRHLPVDPDIRANGIAEDRPLAFETPYGCSKGAADQYVLDHARSLGMRTAVLRMSCVYGPHQFGTEDQGWVAHFLLQALREADLTIYGDGLQVRDVLHVHDAVAAYRAVLDRIDDVSGEVFNLGGGPNNAVGLNDVIAEIGRITGRAPRLSREAARPGDQRYFVADTRRLEAATGWRHAVPWRRGLADLAGWMVRHRLAPHERPEAIARREVA